MLQFPQYKNAIMGALDCVFNLLASVPIYHLSSALVNVLSQSVLPSVRSELPHSKFDRKNIGEVIGLLLANEAQVAYWGLSEAEMIQITMASADKLAKLDAILSVKEFIDRNCPKSPPADHDYGRDLHGQSWSNVVQHGSTSLADALGGAGGQSNALQAALGPAGAATGGLKGALS